MTDADHVVRIRDQLGPCVLLKVPIGEKGPRIRGWQRLRQTDMTLEYLASVNHGQNIGVLLGGPSEGLCTIDADGDEGSSGVQENGFGRNCFYAGCIRL